MRPTPNHKSQAFTLVELIVVIAVLVIGFVLFSMFFRGPSRVRHGPRITCVSNLHQIGVAYVYWAGDHNGRYPASESVSNGGWRECLTNADQGFLCWTNYAIMAREMGQSPKALVCPSDERKFANAFTNFANTNLSYFVGVSADQSQPQSLLAGDRNLSAGTKAGNNYGYSSKDGQGNDVAVQTNSQTSPVCWSLTMHSLGKSAGAGNILLGDGSAQEVDSGNFRTNWQPFGGLTTNWPAGHVPPSPSFRVLFP
jgi:prepilin-type N-terminal cleavage/methylation domain-containing protein